ncbi:hypothetical protein [Actinomadura luteofluorescens]|uniref:hypothetical protein n=1 Tax=Actinomadura luteofluorescens TaxID=46163 RepID=UPI003D8B1B69
MSEEVPAISAIPARFRPVPDVAYATGRPHRTIRTWAAGDRIETMRHPKTGALLVDLVAAAKLSDQAGRRRRKPR